MKRHQLGPMSGVPMLLIALVPICLSLLATTVAGQHGIVGADWVWSRVIAGGSKPAGREGHATVEVGNRLYVIGGCLMDIKCFNDVHIFDTETLTWSQMAVHGEAPEPRGGHSATLVGTDIYVFGGASSEAAYDDVYKLDLVGQSWTRAEMAVRGHGPTKRTNHAAAADKEGRVYIFGGYDADGNYLNDMWILSVYWNGPWADPSSVPVTWEAPVPSGVAPGGREGHSMILVRRKLFVFGGYTALGHTANDLHVYDIDGQAWVSVSVALGSVPPPRQSHSASRHGAQIVIAGGCDISPSSQVCYNDVWSLDTTGLRWTPKSSDKVTLFPREGHSSSFVRGRMFIFGGCELSSECYNDIISLDTADPCPAGCGGNGQCKDAQFCQCRAGFTGHDCLQPQSCPFDCSGRGTCQPSGSCACQNGFTGTSCERELPCPGYPLKCSNHGSCLLDGTCQCQAGFFGPDCSGGSAAVTTPPAAPVVLTAAAAAPIPPAAKATAGLVITAQRSAVLGGRAQNGQQKEASCPQNCCGHGSCGRRSTTNSSNTCSCAPGWYGPACSFDDAAWAMVSRYDQQTGADALHQADEKRQQARRSMTLASMIQEAAAQKGSERSAVVAQLQQLKQDVKELNGEADVLEARAKTLQDVNADGKGSAAFEELQRLTGVVVNSCTPLPPGGASGLLALAKIREGSGEGAAAPLGGPAKQAAANHSTSTSGSFAVVNAFVAQPLSVHVPPKINDFGIPQENKEGKTGIEDAQCKENCNFRGVCSDGTCYCQPGYYGETCGTLKEKKAGSIALMTVILISAGCVTVSFLFTLCFLTVTERQKRRKEKEMGYNV